MNKQEALPYFTENELLNILEEYPEEVTRKDIITIFFGKKVSTARFRKYIQDGLVERSRRKGPKGKHKGSYGLYPIDTIFTVNWLKKAMYEGYTLEEVAESTFPAFLELKEALRQMRQGVRRLMFQESVDKKLENSLVKTVGLLRRDLNKLEKTLLIPYPKIY